MLKINLKENLPKFLYWLTITIVIISFFSLFVVWRIDLPIQFHWLKDFHKIGGELLGVISLITIVLLILSRFIKMERRFLWITLFLSFFISFFLVSLGEVPTPSLDAQRKIHLTQLRTAENLYFDKHQRYANYSELEQEGDLVPIPKDPATGEPYIFFLTEDKQDFEIRAKLNKGVFFICNKRGCEEH